MMSNEKSQIIIAFVGMPGSGKGTCAEYVAEKHNLPIVHFGNMVYDEVQRRGLDNVKDEKYVREDMRAREGKAVLAKHASRKAKDYFDAGAQAIVFDGLYSWSEYKYLSHMYGGKLVVIAITAPRRIRYERILAREDSHRKYKNISQIKDRDIAEIENLEKGGPIAFADYTLVNNRTKEELLAELDGILSEIGIGEQPDSPGPSNPANQRPTIEPLPPRRMSQP